jgi:hypothetical protein
MKCWGGSEERSHGYKAEFEALIQREKRRAAAMVAPTA